jgi:predicted acetyltransferase
LDFDLTDTDYDEYLSKAVVSHKNIDLPVHLVPSSVFFFMNEEEDRILGAVGIRHRLNERLLHYGGNIGYGVRPTERRKGYATKILALALDKCGDMGLSKVLITCSKSNVGSYKAILHNGGLLENEILEESGRTTQRYWISL